MFLLTCRLVAGCGRPHCGLLLPGSFPQEVVWDVRKTVYCVAVCCCLALAMPGLALADPPAYSGFLGAQSVFSPKHKPIHKPIVSRSLVRVLISGNGGVSSLPQGIDCGRENSGVCRFYFQPGVLVPRVTLQAQAGKGWVFAGWQGVCRGQDDCTLSIRQGGLVQARFVPQAPPRVALLLDAGSGNGIQMGFGLGKTLWCKKTCHTHYPLGGQLTLLAKGKAGYLFRGWQGCDQPGDQVSYDGYCFVNLIRPHQIKARFAPVPKRRLHLVVLGHGAVVSKDWSCQDRCWLSKNLGSQVQLQPQADPGWHFAGWKGACRGQGQCQLVLDKDQTLQARFIPLRHWLKFSVKGQGQAQVLPSGRKCRPGAACQILALHGTVFNLQAQAKVGWRISGWQGDCQGKRSCQVSLDQDRSAQVIFEPIPRFRLQVKIQGPGRVWDREGKMACPGVCQGRYLQNSLARLHAKPPAGYRLLAWRGACQGQGVCRLRMIKPHQVEAIFAPLQYQLLIQSRGGVIVAPAIHLTCRGVCQGQYDRGSKMVFVAKPDPGYRFLGWQGACSGKRGCRTVLYANQQLGAVFQKIPSWQIKLSSDQGGMVLLGGQGKVGSGRSRSVDVMQGAKLAALAYPKAGYQFRGWQGGCNQSALCQIGENQTQDLTALFQKTYYLLGVTHSPGGRVQSDWRGIDCGGRCLAYPGWGALVHLTPLPEPGMKFAAWLGKPCQGQGGDCWMKIWDSYQVRALFIRKEQPVSPVLQDQDIWGMG